MNEVKNSNNNLKFRVLNLLRVSSLEFRVSRERGLSLIEILVYVALLGMIAVFVSNSLIQLSNTYQRARAEREVLSNARLILETVNKSVSQAQEIYTPTNKFNAFLGQLSLITTLGADANHAAAYADFYVDNGRFFVRQEGQNVLPVSASSVKVDQFLLERISQGVGRDAVKITLIVSSSRAKFPSSATLNSTTALRGNY